MQVFDSHATCVSFGHALAWTCVDFGQAQVHMQASQHKLITRHLYICIKFTTCMNLSADLQICLATHRNLYASSGFANLCGLASTFKSVWPGVEVMCMCISVHHCCAYKCYLLLLVITTKLLSFVWALNSWKHTKLNNEKISSVSYPELFSIYLHMWDPHFIKKDKIFIG